MADNARCDNCGTVTPVAELNESKRLTERLDPGGTVPAGECPKCGALAYPVEATTGAGVYEFNSWLRVGAESPEQARKIAEEYAEGVTNGPEDVQLSIEDNEPTFEGAGE